MTNGCFRSLAIIPWFLERIRADERGRQEPNVRYFKLLLSFLLLAVIRIRFGFSSIFDTFESFVDCIYLFIDQASRHHD